MIIQLLGSRVAVWPVRAGGCAELTIVLHAQKLESVDASGLKLDSRASFLPPRICMSLHRTPELASTEPSASVVAVAYQRSWAIRLAVLHAFAVPATEGLKMSAVLVPTVEDRWPPTHSRRPSPSVACPPQNSSRESSGPGIGTSVVSRWGNAGWVPGTNVQVAIPWPKLSPAEAAPTSSTLVLSPTGSRSTAA